MSFRRPFFHLARAIHLQSDKIAPSFFGVMHRRGAPPDSKRPTPLHSVLKRDWHVIVNAEAVPERSALLRASPQGYELASEGVECLMQGSGPFDSSVIAAATEEKQAMLQRHRDLSAEKLAAADPATLKTTPKAAPPKKKKK
jgi:hypothetical protein